jgi:hypothetical protein
MPYEGGRLLEKFLLLTRWTPSYLHKLAANLPLDGAVSVCGG